MNGSFRKLALVILATASATSQSLAQNANAPVGVEIDTHVNFLAQSGDWTASGAFTDQGVISDVIEHAPKGNPAHAPNLYVVETLSGAGGTFTWSFTRHIAPVAGPRAGQNSTYKTGGDWHITDGTGAYSGITGQGTFSGTINPVTGDIFETFQGHVQLEP